MSTVGEGRDREALSVPTLGNEGESVYAGGTGASTKVIPDGLGRFGVVIHCDEEVTVGNCAVALLSGTTGRITDTGREVEVTVGTGSDGGGSVGQGLPLPGFIECIETCFTVLGIFMLLGGARMETAAGDGRQGRLKEEPG